MLRQILDDLGIPPNDERLSRLPVYEEADELVDVGPNLIGRMQRLAPRAAAGWHGMLRAAAADGVTLMIVSGFRSYEYQAALIQKKLESGQSIDDILLVNAAPGFSQHHTGLALDIATPGSRPLTEAFETTEAFRWLEANAKTHGFSMSYPRNNPEGFIYEPWHWSM